MPEPLPPRLPLPPFDEAVVFQAAQRLREHLLAHAADLAAQFAEAVRAAQQRHEQQHAPAAGHVHQHVARRACGGQQVAAAHVLGQGRAAHRAYLQVRTRGYVLTKSE